MSGYQASIQNTPYARHFGTARQYAQEAYAKHDTAKLAAAIREISDGLMGLALDLSLVKQIVADAGRKR